MVIRVKIRENPSATGRKQRSLSSKRLGDHPSTMKQGAKHHLRAIHRPRDDEVEYHYTDLPLFDPRSPTASKFDSTTRKREDPRSLSSSRKQHPISVRDDTRNHDQRSPPARRSRSKKSVETRDETKNPEVAHQSRSRTTANTNVDRRGRSKTSSSSRRFATAPAVPARRPPPRKTVYVPLRLELLEIHSSSSRSTTVESNMEASTKEDISPCTGPPLPSDTTSKVNKDYKDRSSYPDDDDHYSNHDGLSSSPGRDEAPDSSWSPSSPRVTFINTNEQPVAMMTGRPSMHALASRPATPSIFKYARYSEPMRAIHKNEERMTRPSKVAIAHQSRAQKANSPWKPRVVGRSLSPARRDRRRDDDGNDDIATSEPRRSKSERATRTCLDLGVGNASYYEHPSHPNTVDDKLWLSSGYQEAKSKVPPGRTKSSWGLPMLISKVMGKDVKLHHDSERGFLLNGAKPRNKKVCVANKSHQLQHRHDYSIDDDFGRRTGKQIQFLSNVVNKFGSFGGDGHDDEEAGDAQKLCEIIRTTEELEKKLEDVGDPTKPSMTPYQVGELISALSKMHAHAAHLGRNSRCVSGGPAEEGGDAVVVEHNNDCSSWLDTLSQAMFGHCEWK